MRDGGDEVQEWMPGLVAWIGCLHTCTERSRKGDKAPTPVPTQLTHFTSLRFLLVLKNKPYVEDLSGKNLGLDWQHWL